MTRVISIREGTYKELVVVCGNLMTKHHYPISLWETVQQLIDQFNGKQTNPRPKGRPAAAPSKQTEGTK